MTSVVPTGPPPVRTATRANTWHAPSIPVTSTNRITGRSSGSVTRRNRCHAFARGRRERVAAVPARDTPAAPPGDPVRAGHGDARRVPGVRSGRGPHGGRPGRHHGRHRVSDLPDRLGAAPVRRCERTLAPAVRAAARGHTNTVEAARSAGGICVDRNRDECSDGTGLP